MSSLSQKKNNVIHASLWRLPHLWDGWLLDCSVLQNKRKLRWVTAIDTQAAGEQKRAVCDCKTVSSTTRILFRKCDTVYFNILLQFRCSIEVGTFATHRRNKNKDVGKSPEDTAVQVGPISVCIFLGRFQESTSFAVFCSGLMVASSPEFGIFLQIEDDGLIYCSVCCILCTATDSGWRGQILNVNVKFAKWLKQSKDGWRLQHKIAENRRFSSWGERGLCFEVDRRRLRSGTRVWKRFLVLSTWIALDSLRKHEILDSSISNTSPSSCRIGLDNFGCAAWVTFVPFSCWLFRCFLQKSWKCWTVPVWNTWRFVRSWAHLKAEGG